MVTCRGLDGVFGSKALAEMQTDIKHREMTPYLPRPQTLSPGHILGPPWLHDEQDVMVYLTFNVGFRTRLTASRLMLIYRLNI